MASPPPDSLLGRVVDEKYRIQARIGSGSMGTVYRAEHVSLGAPRALKVMRRELAEHADFVERFQREARIVEGLRHPSLVALYDFGCLEDGTWYIVSEFVEGETLAGLMRDGRPFGASEVALLLGQVADGLAVAHRKGIVHRDISPDNIMIAKGEDGRPVAKLVDFGVAKSVVDAARAKSAPTLLFGKVGYAAPEQMGLLPKGEELDQRADVFSLSAVALEMLTGRLPWRKDSVQSYVHDLLVRPEHQTQEAIEAAAPVAWRPALGRGLARDRRARTVSAPALKADLADAATRADSPELPTPLRRPRRRWLGAAVFATVLAAIALAMTLRSSPPVPAERPAPAAGPPVTTPAPEPPPQATASPAAEARAEPVVRATPRPAPPTPSAPAVRAAVTPEPAATAPPPVAGNLDLDAVPPASVILDGQPRGRTPLRLSPVTAGLHSLVLTTDDGLVYQEQVSVGPGQSVERRHRFPGFGSVSVVSDVWVEVSVDGGPAQQTPCHIERLVAGSHVLRASRSGYADKRIEFEVREGETASVRVDLERR